MSMKSPMSYISGKFCVHFMSLFFLYGCCCLPYWNWHVSISITDPALYKFDHVINKVFVSCKVERDWVMNAKIKEEHTFSSPHVGRIEDIIHMLKDNGFVKVVWRKL